MLEFYFPQGGRDTELRAGSADASTPPVWIDLLDPTADERARVEREYGIRVPSREQLEEIESSSRLRMEREQFYLSMPLPFEDDRAAPAPVPLGFILAPALLVTVRFAEIHSFADVRARLKRGELPADSQTIFTTLVEAMVDAAADALEKRSGELAAADAHLGRRSRRPALAHPGESARAHADHRLRVGDGPRSAASGNPRPSRDRARGSRLAHRLRDAPVGEDSIPARRDPRPHQHRAE